MNILFFGRYDPDYSRNRVLLKGLRENDVRVIECKVSPSNRLWPLLLFIKYIFLGRRFDVILVPFPGQEVMILARMLTKKPIIFDAFTSHYEGYVLDRGTVAPDSRRAHRYRKLDKNACEKADVCLTDTKAHADWYIQEFQLPPEKFVPILVGTDTDIFRPGTNRTQEDEFRVHFHGSYIPLQGADTIVRAAALLKKDGVRFSMIGKGQTYESVRSLADELGADNIVFGKNVAYEKLADLMRNTDVCLGIFGTTQKAQRVISNKVYEALGVAKPVITADSPAARELLDEQSAVLVPPGDARALADAIMRLKHDPELRKQLAQTGHARLMSGVTERMLGKKIIQTINERGLL